jgi:hypothetical protein
MCVCVCVCVCLIPPPEESYRVCVSVCVLLSVITDHNNLYTYSEQVQVVRLRKKEQIKIHNMHSGTTCVRHCESPIKNVATSIIFKTYPANLMKTEIKGFQ